MLGPGVTIVSPYFHHIGGQPTFKRVSVVPVIPAPRLLYVWATGITYVPMAKGFVYLVAIVDWFSRKVLAWRVSISMETDFCIEALEEALARYGKPQIFNTDQGSQFTSQAFTSVLHREEIAISMDGRGAWRDNVIVERLWRSVKYEEVYLRAYGAVSEARGSIGRYLTFYNSRRPHSSLATPSLRDAPCRQFEKATGRRSTYPSAIPVQTNPVTSVSYVIFDTKREWRGQADYFQTMLKRTGMPRSTDSTLIHWC